MVLFNSGVGYFSRSGEVEGDARVDLTFPESDVNDLLKSMVLEDFNKGRISGRQLRQPRADRPHALQLRHQPQRQPDVRGHPRRSCAASGSRWSISPTAANQPGKLSGTIVGVEKQKVPAGTQTVDAEVLNMWCAEGMRSIKTSDIQSLRFTQPGDRERVPPRAGNAGA